MIFVKNLKILLSLIFFEKDLDMMSNNVLNRKKGFLGYKNVILTKWDNVLISKRVKPGFWSKI